jgi:ATP-dependent exoDNAse (exonuclease V) alpha subunit
VTSGDSAPHMLASEEWSRKKGKVRVVLRQIPVVASWALTIHKSQGMSLDRADVSIGQSFESGQGYVGLSRVRTPEGLRLLDFSPSAITANEDVRDFYESVVCCYTQLDRAGP